MGPASNDWISPMYSKSGLATSLTVGWVPSLLPSESPVSLTQAAKARRTARATASATAGRALLPIPHTTHAAMVSDSAPGAA